MQRLFIGALLAVAACGGATHKPADTEANSLPEPSAAASADMPAAPEAPPAAASSAPAESAAPSAPLHPVPSTSGAIDGKPFAPKIAQLGGRIQKDGRVVVVLQEGTDCVAAGDAKPGDASLSITVPWQDGMKVDLAALKRPKGKAGGEISFVRVNDKKKTEVSASFKPTGTVTIVSAPTQRDAVGKMKIDLTSGDYMLAGDLDVKVCSSAK
jgi:hypothetical protein